MAQSIDDLSTPPTTREIRDVAYATLTAVGSAPTSWKPGAWVRTIVAMFVLMFTALAKNVADLFRLGFWQLATGDFLRLSAKYAAGITPRTATFAPGFVTLINAGLNVYTIDPGDVTVANTTTGKTYRNTATDADPVTLAAGSSVTIPILADEIGSASTSAPGTITTLVTAMPGVTCTNAQSVVGFDDEDEASIVRRCDLAAASASPMGSREAYKRFAMFDAEDNPLTKPDGTLVDVIDVKVSYASATNTVRVWARGSSGAVSGDADDPDTDLGAIDANLRRYALPEGVTLETLTVDVLTVDFTWGLVVDSRINLSDAAIAAKCGAALTVFLAAQPIGGWQEVGTGTVYLEGIRSALKGADPKILSVTMTTPVVDLTPAGDEVVMPGTLSQTSVTRVLA